MYSVINFDIDAGGKGLLAFFSRITVPVVWSRIYAAFADVSNESALPVHKNALNNRIAHKKLKIEKHLF
jgi:hypothetical protein